MTSPLQSSAMLVALNISSWSARKLDRAATQEVDVAHGAKGAGRYNKLLIDKEALEPIEKIEGAARAYHYSMTLPWGNNGERILPARLFMDYVQAMGQFKDEFKTRVRTFAAEYPALVQARRKSLGTLYRPEDYPVSVVDKFSFETPVTPIPSANDFRVELDAEHLKQIRADILERQQAQQAQSVQHVWTRVREAVGKMAEVCSKDKPRIFDSMTENIETLARVLPAMNLTNDPELDRVARELEKLCVSPDMLRTHAHLRAEAARNASAILGSLP